VGVEFGGPSVTSLGFEIDHPRVDKGFIGDAFLRMMPDLKYAQTRDRGYLLVTLTPGEARCEWLFVTSVFENNFSVSLGQTLRTLPGSANRTVVPA
jgi:alkaline phosphatase D